MSIPRESELFPRIVEPFDQQNLKLTWSDGQCFSIPYAELRFQCPCAACVDEHTGRRIIERSTVSNEIKPTGVSTIGRYALQFNWSDGHSTGMYHYDRLREICVTDGKPLA